MISYTSAALNLNKINSGQPKHTGFGRFLIFILFSQSTANSLYYLCPSPGLTTLPLRNIAGEHDNQRVKAQLKMDVHLLVYDLTRGLARQMSLGLLGFQLDAVYHTSIELQGREYVYDGGIISIVPGTSHLGQPMERLHLGKTSLPMDVIGDYLESIRSIFTIEV